MYKRHNQGWLKHIDFILWDAAALQLAFVLGYYLRMNHGLVYAAEAYRSMAMMYAAVDILIAAMFNTMHNVLKRTFVQEFVQSLKQVLLVFLLISLYMFSTKSGTDYSRIVIYLTAGLHMVIGVVVRLLWKQVIMRAVAKRAKDRMILVADERHIQEIIERVRPIDDFEICGLVLSNRDGIGEEIAGIPVVANLENAADYICVEWVDEVFIYPEHMGDIDVSKVSLYADAADTPYREHHSRSGTQTVQAVETGSSVALLIRQCREMAIPVHIRLPLSDLSGRTFLEKVGGYDVVTSTANYASGMQLLMKRVLDIIGGLVGSVIAVLIMIVVGPIIKHESPGPILFKQIRIGRNGQKFQVYKIRSMYMDAEERKKDLMENNRVSDGMMFKLDWDPRIIGNKIVDGKQMTGIGQLVRNFSLDEYAQFFNVLRGEMSMVGTRPPTVDEWEKYRYHHRARMGFKPGITGMWQVSGRSKITDFEEVVRLDTEYINHWSLWLDIKILFKTIGVVLKRDGAM